MHESRNKQLFWLYLIWDFSSFSLHSAHCVNIFCSFSVFYILLFGFGFSLGPPLFCVWWCRLLTNSLFCFSQRSELNGFKWYRFSFGWINLAEDKKKELEYFFCDLKVNFMFVRHYIVGLGKRINLKILSNWNKSEIFQLLNFTK